MGVSRYSPMQGASVYDEDGSTVFERHVTREELIAEGSLFPGEDEEYEYYTDDDEFIEDYGEPYEPYELVEGAYLPAYRSYASTTRPSFRPEHLSPGSSDGSEVAIPVAATTVYVPASTQAEARQAVQPGAAFVER